jgi:hypothetical protein
MAINYNTNVPAPTFGATGFQTVAESAILQGVIQDYQTAFGGALNLDPTLINTGSLTTPQGQLATSETAIIASVYSEFLSIVSQVDPQYAQGIMQDAIGNIYFMNRYPATGTTVTATLGGNAGVVVPGGVAVAQDYGGNLYSLANPVTIPSTGTIAVTLTNMQTGPLTYNSNFGANPMSIYMTIPGWSNISGPVQTQLGTLVENSQQFEIRRQNSVAVNAGGTTSAVRAAVMALTPSAVPSSVYVVDNSNNYSITYGGITLPANSIYVCAYNYPVSAPWGTPSAAGTYTPMDVPKAIWSRKSLGCSYAPSVIVNATVSGTALTVNTLYSGTIAWGQTLLQIGGAPYITSTGSLITIISGSGTSWTLSGTPSISISNTTVWSATNAVVTDPTYAVAPQPTYNVQYTIPTVLPIYIQVTLAAASNPPSTALTTLQSSTGIVTAFTGLDGLQPVSQIGATVFASRFYPTVAALIPGASITSVLVNTLNSFTSSNQSVSVNINQIPTFAQVSLVLV